MKLCIAGSRTLGPKAEFIKSACEMLEITNITEVVSGCASGVDGAGEVFADLINIPVEHFHANWDKYGRSAGPIRNKQMAEYSDVLLLIWDGKSRGSANCKSEFEKLNKPIYEVILRKY
jgi:hypothetical protein